MKLLNKFLETIKKYDMIIHNDKIVVGVSGGADSICLLDLFLCVKELFNLDIIVAHLNHDLRGMESDSDELFVRNICLKKEIVFESRKINVKDFAKVKRFGIEQAARVCRYEFFFSLLSKYNANKIATAHNKNDNVETILLKLTRGCGSNGLIGINPNNNGIIRPLIDISRTEIEFYCDKNKIEYVTDSSNLSCEYARNKIRNKIMPVLSEINPKFINTFIRSVNIIHDENSYLEQKAIEFINRLGNKNEISVLKLKTMPTVLASKVIYLMLKGILKDNFDFKHVGMVLGLVDKHNKKRVCLPNGVFVQKIFDEIVFYDHSKPVPQQENIEKKIELNKLTFVPQLNKFLVVTDQELIDPQKKSFVGSNFVTGENGYKSFDCGELDLKDDTKKNDLLRLVYKKVFCCDTINWVLLRDYRHGDKIFFEGVGHKKLKKLLSEKKISLTDSFVWVVLANNNIVWVVGENIDVVSNSTRGEKKYFIYVLEGNSSERYQI